MITEIPTRSEFEASAIALLNLAWTTVIELCQEASPDLLSLDMDAPPGEEIEDAFWRAAQQPLANAAVLVQQGIEFLLKGRIAEVSPYILIALSPRDWPSRCDRQDTPFADFRTLDAQDLPRMHDAVCQQRLSPSFTSRIQELRRLRNSIVHTVDARVRVAPNDLLVFVLEAHRELLPGKPWLDIRRDYLAGNHHSALYGHEYADIQLSVDAVHMIHLLRPAQLKTYWGVDKRRRWYLCPECTEKCRDADFYPRTAQLKATDQQKSEAIDCVVCSTSMAVARKRCVEEDCRGDVFSITKPMCLTCGCKPPRAAG